MKIKTIFLTIAILLVAFPIFKVGALAEFVGPVQSSMPASLEPVNMILLGIGLMFAGTRA